MVAVIFLVLAALPLLAAPAVEESFRSGLLALQRNDLTAAQTDLEAAAGMAPGNARVLVALAQTYRKLHSDAKAEEAAIKAEKLGAADGVIVNALAVYYSDAGQFEKAADTQARYASLLAVNTLTLGKADSVYFAAVQPLLEKQMFAPAVRILEPAHNKIRGSAQLELALGVAYYGLRRFDEAATAFLRTIDLTPESEQPYVFLGRMLDQTAKRLPELTKRFAAYESAHPESYLGYFLHAKALDARSAEPETARALLEKAVSLKDGDAAVHFELGTVFEKLQRYADAARELEKAASIEPNDPATHYRLARVYDRAGNARRAQAERDLHAKLVRAQDSIR